MSRKLASACEGHATCENVDAVLGGLLPTLARPKKRSLAIAGHRTSITLEDAFWDALKTAAAESGQSVASLVAAIDGIRGAASLSAAIRVFLFARAKRCEAKL